jgi:hypothetical protein
MNADEQIKQFAAQEKWITCEARKVLARNPRTLKAARKRGKDLMELARRADQLVREYDRFYKNLFV